MGSCGQWGSTEKQWLTELMTAIGEILFHRVIWLIEPLIYYYIEESKVKEVF